MAEKIIKRGDHTFGMRHIATGWCKVLGPLWVDITGEKYIASNFVVPCQCGEGTHLLKVKNLVWRMGD